MLLNTLQIAVIEQLGYTVEDFGQNEDLTHTLEDISNYGSDGGFDGFTYHTDTVAFYDKNKADILTALHEDADSFGQSVWEMVSYFNCMRNLGPIQDSFEIDGHENETHIKNCLAWYAAEKVAQELLGE